MHNNIWRLVFRVRLHARKVHLQLRGQAKQWTAALFVLAAFSVCLWVFWLSWEQYLGIDIGIKIRSMLIKSISTVVTVDTFDPDTSSVLVHTSTTVDQTQLLFDPDVNKQIPELSNYFSKHSSFPKYRMFYQQPNVSELSSIYQVAGLGFVDQSISKPKFDRIKSNLITNSPADSVKSIPVIGDPRLFPFDRYWILFRVDEAVFMQYRNKAVYLESKFEVLPRFPGFIVRELSSKELEGYRGWPNGVIKIDPANYRYDSRFWYGPGVALSIERPFFLKAMTVVIGIVAVLTMIFVYFLSDPSKYFLNALGTFAALWGARTILTASAPKSPNIIDHFVLFLFTIQFLLVGVKALFRDKQKSNGAIQTEDL